MSHEPDEDIETFRSDLARHIANGRSLLTSGILKLDPRPYSRELAEFHLTRERLRVRLPGLTQPLARELAYTPIPADWAMRTIAGSLDADLFGRYPRLYDDVAEISLSYLDEAIGWRRRRLRLAAALERHGVIDWFDRHFGRRAA